MDISQREGKYPPPPGASDLLGVEFSGTVTELGQGVKEWKVGDEVLGLVGGVCPAMKLSSVKRTEGIHI
jgi:NADPH:quinone reductase-like Zn-dependent oxidoreductase